MHFSVERFTELKLNYTTCNNGHNNTLLSFNGESFWNKKYYVFPLGKIGHFSKVVVFGSQSESALFYFCQIKIRRHPDPQLLYYLFFRNPVP